MNRIRPESRAIDAEALPSSAPPSRLPDFIIGGAMKAGTTSLHHALAHHPEVFIPERELHFFCLDDIAEHPDYMGPVDGEWIRHDFDRDFEAYFTWYRSFFDAAGPTRVIGERSTVYLASSKAPERIARLLPDVKLVFVLRDPVQRTYSHYWHRVRSGEVVAGFEQTLRYAPHTLLTRSLYKRQLEAYLQRFPRENIEVLVFEELVRDVQGAVDRVVHFLGLRGSVDVSTLDTRRHVGSAPRFPRLAFLQNRLLRDSRVADRLPDLPNLRRQESGALVRFGLSLDRIVRSAHLRKGAYPLMRPDTRAFLEELFARENAGLSELLDIDLRRYWPYL